MAKTMRTFGSRRKVWNGTAQKTPGGLTRGDLMQNKYGRIVSRKKAAHARSARAFTRRK
jgi:DVNP family